MNSKSQRRVLSLRERQWEKEGFSSGRRELLQKLSSLIEDLAPFIDTCDLTLNSDDYDLVSIVPKNNASSPVQLYIYRSDPDDTMTVGVEAGAGTYFNVPADVYPPLEGDTVEVVVSAVRAVADGHLEETIKSAGDEQYRCDFQLATSSGLINLQRVNVAARIKTLLRGRHSKTVRYDAYSHFGAR